MILNSGKEEEEFADPERSGKLIKKSSIGRRKKNREKKFEGNDTLVENLQNSAWQF